MKAYEIIQGNFFLVHDRLILLFFALETLLIILEKFKRSEKNCFKTETDNLETITIVV